MAYNRWQQEVLLHYHGDGAKALMPVLPQLFEMSGKPYPFSGTPEEQHNAVKAVFANPQIDIVQRFSNTTGVMQSRETLMLAAESWVRELAKEGYKYVEVTIAPQYHVFCGLTEEEAVAALIEGIKRGETQYPKIEVNLLFTVGREVSPEEGVRLVEAAARCDRNYVVGIGLVCDEAGHPPTPANGSIFRRTNLIQKKTETSSSKTSSSPSWTSGWTGSATPSLLPTVRTL